MWGPPLWHALFACALHARNDARKVERLRRLLLEVLPHVIPCRDCRANYARHLPSVDRKCGGPPRDGEHAFVWLWWMKDAVNRTLFRVSLPIEQVRQRYAFHGLAIDEVALGDALVLVAVQMQRMREQRRFVELCAALVALAPFPEDSELVARLRSVRPMGIVADAVAAAAAARVERGVPPLSLADYTARVTDD